MRIRFVLYVAIAAILVTAAGAVAKDHIARSASAEHGAVILPAQLP